jgi:hypothetical protein
MAGSRQAIQRLLSALLLLPTIAAADEATRASPPRIEAAFLRNFAHYLAWPPGAFTDEHSPWRICVAGNDPFGEILDETLRSRSEHGRQFVVVRSDAAVDLRQCHVLYIAYRSGEQRRGMLTELANRPVLTVGDAPTFLQEGGIIRFHVSDRVGISVNLDRANLVAVKIPANVLEVSQEVVENGVVRRLR